MQRQHAANPWGSCVKGMSPEGAEDELTWLFSCADDSSAAWGLQDPNELSTGLRRSLRSLPLHPWLHSPVPLGRDAYRAELKLSPPWA